MLDDKRRVGCEGCSARFVTVSVCDSMYERRGTEGLRWSLEMGQLCWVRWVRGCSGGYQM